MPILTVKNLNFSYDSEKQILKDVSFSVEAGEYVALIGHNGSGKSTLAKVLMGLNKKYEGEITIFDIPLEEKKVDEIHKRLGIVFQNPDNQFVASTVREDIVFGLENRCAAREEMDAIIDQYVREVGMEKFLDSAPENLSGGQKQRVAIAGVLAMQPDLIILDEATSMLDPKGKGEILNLIHEMRKNNPKLTILSITHDVEEAYRADKVLVLNKGEMLLSGTPEEVFSHRDTLNRIHLGAPFFLQLKQALNDRGIKIPETVKNMQELEDYLCR